jgi:glutamate racemase
MIGVFDSGHGGLTILRSLVTALPERSFVYLGDHAHAPYGGRSSAEIVDLTRSAVEMLFDIECDLVVLACNTAAAVALRTLQQDWLPVAYEDRRILGVLVPTVEAVTGVPWLIDPAHVPAGRPQERPKTIAVFATRRTVESNAYPEEVDKRASGIDLIQVACEGLVDLIERHAPRDVLRTAVHGYVGALTARLAGKRLDAVLLGCTHYPLVADLFAEALPPGVEILSQPDLVARSLADYLIRHEDLDAADFRGGTLKLLTTGDPDHVSRFATDFFGRPIQFESIGTRSRSRSVAGQVA